MRGRLGPDEHRVAVQLLRRTELEVQRLKCDRGLVEDELDDAEDLGIQIEIERPRRVAVQVRNAIARLPIGAVEVAKRQRALRTRRRNREVGRALLPDVLDVGIKLTEETIIEVEGELEVPD